jgi:hypothetical protein
MLKLHDFLVEHAKFPFPHADDSRSTSSTDISNFEVALLEKEWKAQHAVRDDILVQKLCRSLENILGDTLLSPESKGYLLASFRPGLQFDDEGEEINDWLTNASEREVSFSDISRFPSKLSNSG